MRDDMAPLLRDRTERQITAAIFIGPKLSIAPV